MKEFFEEITPLLVALLPVVIALYALYKAHESGRPLDGAYLTATLQEAQGSAAELTEVALTGAQAAEQLFRSGKLPKGERFDRAFAYVDNWFGGRLDEATVTSAIEAAVLVVNTLVDALPVKG